MRKPLTAEEKKIRHRDYMRAYAAKYPERIRATNARQYQRIKRDPHRMEKQRLYAANRRYLNRPLEIYRRLKTRCKQDGTPFNLTPDDIVVPVLCPLLGTPIRIYPSRDFRPGGPRPDTPSVDRINPKKGYVKGNVWVVSHRANAIKQNATLKELETLVRNLKKKVMVFR